ncbi:hypothetical protein HS048_35495 [Planomonospora sp. ID91781]|uniref:hypothetical protein n=1 Tax=Planomonospora sp. ID91781 TaxID=2738135 RepID=UPI0018C3F1FC|nr:hypothetical protein [Planomonospora sp. ID91781]MBG0825978.1 hypothetical protein [Planomonospora sp. ID91781]
MSTTKNGSYSLSEVAHGFIESGAERDGLSKSAWVEKAVTYYALVTGAPTTEAADDLAAALADEHEASLADDEFRERGAA